MFRNQTFSVLRFLIVFAILYYGFIAYIGLLSPGGKGYSPLLERYANVPAWITYGLCSAAKSLLQALGYDVYQKAANNITIRGSRGINIIWACLGVGVMSFWTAFVVAHKARLSYKAKWVSIGILTITAINIIRLDLIALGFHYNWERFNALDIHASFTVVSYAAIIGLILWFLRQYKRSVTNRVSGNNNPGLQQPAGLGN